MTDTCAPPPEHQGHEWHWVRKGDWTQPMQWDAERGFWWHKGYYGGDLEYGERMYEGGWRYVGPAIPPATPSPGAPTIAWPPPQSWLEWLCVEDGRHMVMREIHGAWCPTLIDKDGRGPVVPPQTMEEEG